MRGSLLPEQVWKTPLFIQIIKHTMNGTECSFEEYTNQFPWIKFGATICIEQESIFYEIEQDGFRSRDAKQYYVPEDGTTWNLSFDRERKIGVISPN